MSGIRNNSQRPLVPARPGPHMQRLLLLAWVLAASVATAQDEKPAGTPDKKAEDLTGRLIRKALSESDEDLMGGILRLMGDVARRLEVDFDPGERTQALQQQIAEQLDQTIKTAAAQARVRKQGPSSTNPDKRRMPSTAKREDRKRAPAQGDASKASTSSAGEAAAGNAARPESQAGELTEKRRGWGNLPQRERDEVIQGSGEGFLERYRVWIERYYRALQEADQ